MKENEQPTKQDSGLLSRPLTGSTAVDVENVFAEMNDIQKLNYAVRLSETVFPLPRCKHQNPLRDHSRAKLFPTCGCTE